MEQLWLCLLLITGIMGSTEGEKQTINDMSELSAMVKALKNQQENLLTMVSEQQEEIANIVNQLRIQMRQNYWNQKKELVISKRQIIRRHEKSVASMELAKAENISEISKLLHLHREQTAVYHEDINSQIEGLRQAVQHCPDVSADHFETGTHFKILEGANIPKSTDTTTMRIVTTASETITTIPTPDPRLEKPVMDLDVRGSHRSLENTYRVAALPGGKAAVSVVLNETVQVTLIDNNGSVIRVLNEFPATSNNHYLLNVKDHVYVVHSTGNMTQVHVDNGNIEEYYVDVGALWNAGSLSWDTQNVPDILLLADLLRGEILSFNTSSLEKTIKPPELTRPISVSYVTGDEEISYMVLDEAYDKIIYLYNSTWQLVRSFGAEDLHHATSAIMSPEGTIFITDYWKNRVTEFTTRGQFVRHVITQDDGVRFPVSMSFSYPHLWVTYWPRRDSRENLKPGLCDLKRFKLYSGV